ncbi:MAG: DUF6644 family protein [Acidobacteriota bacterium]
MYDPQTNFLNVHEWAYGLTECVHIVAFAFSFGTIVLVDLGLLGVGLKRITPAKLQRELMLWTLVGLVVVITTGFMIFSTDPGRYYVHPVMRLKVTLLAFAILYHYTIHQRVVRSDDTGGLGKAVALGSIAVWVSIVFCGLFYAFT